MASSSGKKGPGEVARSPSISLDFKTSWVKGAERSLFAQSKSESLYRADQPALPMPLRGEFVRKSTAVRVKPGPIGSFVDVHDHSPHFLRI